jgi:putative ABC transport system permease protein
MSLFRLLFKEILRRKMNFLLALSAVVGATAIFVYLAASSEISKDETRRLMLKMGFNLLILPKSVELSEFWGNPLEAQKHDMPEEYVERMAQMPDVVADHFTAKLEQWIGWRDQSVLLTGLRKEIGTEGKKKKMPLIQPVESGKARVGRLVAQKCGVQKGETIELLGRPFEVEMTLKEQGTRDDSRIYINLPDMQALTNKAGRINVVEALGCKCKNWEVLSTIRIQLEQRLPDVQVNEYRSEALVRAESRDREDRQQAVIFPVVFVVAALWIGLMFVLNVRQRRREIGILRAVGVGGGKIAVLFLGKALLLGLLGAACGFGLGVLLTRELGAYVYKFARIEWEFLWPLLPWAFLTAPLIALFAAALPTLNAVLLDPAAALHEE